MSGSKHDVLRVEQYASPGSLWGQGRGAAGKSTPCSQVHSVLAAPDNYDSVINGGKHAIVEFYAPCECSVGETGKRRHGEGAMCSLVVVALLPRLQGAVTASA